MDHTVFSLNISRYGIGSAIMFGVSPQFIGLWFVWRTASMFLPDWMYQWGDDKLYSLYQRLVLFCFETWTGVEVRNKYSLAFLT